MATRLRNIRVNDETWARWQQAAEREQTAVSDFVRSAVEQAITGVRPDPATRVAMVKAVENRPADKRSAPVPPSGDLSSSFKPNFKAAPVEKKTKRR